ANNRCRPLTYQKARNEIREENYGKTRGNEKQFWLLFILPASFSFYFSHPLNEPPAATTVPQLIGRIFWTTDLDRDSPDESQTGINVRVSPALLQDRREMLTATSTSGNPNAWSRV